MIWLAVFVLVTIVSFGAVLLFGAPYLPTLQPQIKQALELAGLKPGQTLLELGCGDGKVLIAAAEKGLKVVGYELNPFLALTAWLRSRRYKDQVEVHWGNFWTVDWPPADAIYTFLLPKYMSKLDNHMTAYKYKPIKLVSIAFAIPGRSIDKQKNGVNLYMYK